MYDNSETRSKVVQTWAALAGFSDLLPYIPFYTDAGIVSRPSDLYKMSLRHLYANSEVSDEVAYKTLDTISKHTHFSIGRALLALLPDLPPDMVKEISAYPHTIAELVALCKDSAYSEELSEELYRLEQVGVTLTFGEDDIFDMLDATPFTDKKVVVAGKLSADHETVKESLTTLGASIQDKIDKHTDFLVLGEGAPEETDLAIKIGVRILTEVDVAAMLGV